MNLVTQEKLLTITEFADRLGLSPRTISKWCNEGRLTHHKLGDARISPVRIPESELARMLEESVREAKDSAPV